MRCPRCSREGFNPYTLCNKCGFSGKPSQLEELSHIAFVLGELDSWREIAPAIRTLLRERFLRRREALEIDLGLRAPPLSPEEGRKLQWERFCLGELQEETSYWLEQGWVHAGPAERLNKGVQKRAQSLRQRLDEAAPAPTPAFDSVQDRLRLLDYLVQMANLAHKRGYFVDDEAHRTALAEIQADRRDLEINAGLRAKPIEPTPAPVMSAPAPVKKAPPRPPREPLTWDRIWQTVLSEKTLNVLIMLGIFLLVASAFTLVASGTPPPVVQLALIIFATLASYGGGWFLRVRMGLRSVGIGVTALSSLLVPLDFYVVFIVGEVLPMEAWPWVWLMASGVCLPIYTATALRIRAEVFGYLVAVAAGSLLCAALYVVGAPVEWLLAALAALALAFIVLAYRLRLTIPPSPQPSPQGGEGTVSPPSGEGQGEGEGVAQGTISWSILSNPLRFSALIAAAVILPLGVGWRLTSGVQSFDFDASLAIAWTLGAILFAYAAVQEKSPLLGRAAATALPVSLFLLLRLLFEPWAIETPWYALGWAALAPIYLWLGRSAHTQAGDDRVLCAHSHTATGWGLALMGVAAVWSVFDLWAAAATHTALVFGVVLAVRLWDRPRALPFASLLAFSAATFGMAAGHLAPAELCLGWALLAILHVLVAIRLRAAPDHAARLFAAALVLAFLAILPPAILAHETLLTYVLGQWIVLVAWLVWLDRTGEHPGLEALLNRFGPLRQSLLHWAITLALPFFAIMLTTRFRAPDAWLGFLGAALAWTCFVVGRLGGGEQGIRESGTRHWVFPWFVVGYTCSLTAPLLAFYYYDQALLGGVILLAAGLYFVSAWAFDEDRWLIPAGLALPLGLLVLLDFWAVPWAQQSVILASVVAAYLLGGIWLERRRGVPGDFMASLYAVAHLVALAAFFWGLSPIPGHIFNDLPWLDSARVQSTASWAVWAAGGQLILGVAYGLFAWFHAQELWAHVAAWLGVMAGGLIAMATSQGRGSSAFKAALLAAVYVLAERALASGRLQRRWSVSNHAWPLYRRALLIAGWTVSAGAIGLALIRNLVLLGGGYTREVWAIAGLLTVTALYAASAWLFPDVGPSGRRRRRVFLWLAGALVIAPWTLLTLWGWFLWAAPPALPRYALSWAILACLQLTVGILLALRPGRPDSRFPDSPIPDHGFPLRVIANLLLPFALFWAVAEPATSVITWGLGLAFYLASAAADHRRGLSGWRAARFLYPAVAAGAVWAIYLLTYFWPAAPYETYGLLLLTLALPLLAIGRRLRHIEPASALPLYLGAYGVAIVGALLVAHQRPLLAVALTFDAWLCVLSAWLFREPLWGYPAAALAPAALLVALAAQSLHPGESQIPPDRRGWWLIGLGGVYVALAWLLRRVRRHHEDPWAYATPPLVMAFAVVALGLPPSSLDDTGAFWGYLAAALVYAIVAAWLRQPLLLTASAGLLAVPYGVALVWFDVDPANYGLALFPGVVAALALAHLLDRFLGHPGSILPSYNPNSWRLAALLDWWAAPFYAWGYIGALVAVGLTWAESIQLAIALAMAAVVFLQATWRFRSRGYLLLAGVLAQGAALAASDVAGWLAYPSWAALAFLPVAVATALLALAIERWQKEGSPLSAAWWKGWSRPLYLLLVADLLVGQICALTNPEPGFVVTIVHALLLALLATVWVEPIPPFVALGLGVVGMLQGLAFVGTKFIDYPPVLAVLALGYGLLGYGIEYARRESLRARIWRRPLEWSAWTVSAVALLLTAGAGLDVVSLVFRTLFGLPVTMADYAPQIRTAMWVLALNGLLYLATALVRRWWVLGYGAVALLLGAWALWWRFFQGMAGFQWYAVPAGLYLLAVGWAEWRRSTPAAPFGWGSRKTLARWIDRTGMLVWLGTAWWQSLPGVMDNGWPYALLMGGESLLLIWWGSARRQRRFLYIGAAGVILNVVTQSIEPLLSANRWIVFGIAGLLLVSLAILVERKLETIRELSAEMRVRLEEWE